MSTLTSLVLSGKRKIVKKSARSVGSVPESLGTQTPAPQPSVLATAKADAQSGKKAAQRN